MYIFLISLITRAILFVSGIAISIFIAHLIGPEGRGEYVIVLLFMSTVAYFMELGISSGAAYYVSKGFPLSEVYGTSFALGIGIGVVAWGIGGVAWIFLSDFFLQKYRSEWTSYLLVTSFIPLQIVYSILQGLFLGNREILKLNAIYVMPSFLFLFLLYFCGGRDVEMIFILYFISRLTSLAVAVSFIAISCNFKLFVNLSLMKQMVRYGIHVYISYYALWFAINKLDVFVLDYFWGNYVIGIYTLGVMLAEAVWILSQVISTIIFPLISGEENEERRKIWEEISIKLALWGGMLYLLLLYPFADYFLRLYPQEFSSASVIAYILAPGCVLAGVWFVLASILSARGLARRNLYIVLISLVFEVFFAVLVVPYYGMKGAAFSLLLTYIFLFVGTLVFYFDSVFLKDKHKRRGYKGYKEIALKIISLFRIKKEDLDLIHELISVGKKT